jgi:hypothetical protein
MNFFPHFFLFHKIVVEKFQGGDVVKKKKKLLIFKKFEAWVSETEDFQDLVHWQILWRWAG